MTVIHSQKCVLNKYSMLKTTEPRGQRSKGGPYIALCCPKQKLGYKSFFHSPVTPADSTLYTLSPKKKKKKTARLGHKLKMNCMLHYNAARLLVFCDP